MGLYEILRNKAVYENVAGRVDGSDADTNTRVTYVDLEKLPCLVCFPSLLH